MRGLFFTVRQKQADSRGVGNLIDRLHDRGSSITHLSQTTWINTVLSDLNGSLIRFSVRALSNHCGIICIYFML